MLVQALKQRIVESLTVRACDLKLVVIPIVGKKSHFLKIGLAVFYHKEYVTNMQEV